MLRFAFLCCAAVLVGCTKSEDQATDDQTARDTAAAASTTISLADVAGMSTAAEHVALSAGENVAPGGRAG